MLPFLKPGVASISLAMTQSSTLAATKEVVAWDCLWQLIAHTNRGWEGTGWGSTTAIAGEEAVARQQRVGGISKDPLVQLLNPSV